MTAPSSLSGHTVLVTGATGPRIGSGICDALHQAGAQLVINDLAQVEVDATLRRYPGAVGVVGDIADPRDVERIFKEAQERVGQLTGLVNNAGVGLRSPVHEASVDQFDHVAGTDFRGVWLTTKAFVTQRADSTLPAAIVNVSSVHATSTIARFGIYAAAKAAVEGFTRGCAVDLGPAGIRCNAIAPGYVPPNSELLDGRDSRGPVVVPARWIRRHTADEQPLHRVIEPIDCGHAVRFLLSEESRCVTGHVLTVDAGLTARLYNASMSEDMYRNPTMRADTPNPEGR